MLTYLSTAYKGVGRKSAESLLDSFGDDVFRVLTEEPERVTGVLGDRRAGALLESWNEDLARRREAAEPTAAEATPAAAVEAAGESGGEEEQPRSRSRTRRGGRGRPRKRAEPTPGD